MNKAWLVVLVLVAFVGGSVFFANSRSGKTTDTVATDLPATESSSANQETSAIANDSSRYIEYVRGALDKTTDKRRVLYFYASWCPTCRPADEDFKVNASKIPDDVIIFRVNYNDPETDQEEKDLAKKYGITYQHTFVQIDGQGKEVKKWNGGQTEELLTNLK